MGEFVCCPAEAVRAAEAVCGPAVLTVVSDRRGSTVWKACGVAGAMAVKVGYGEGVEVTAREAAVLQRLPGETVAWGRHEGGVWFVTPWLAGASTWGLFEPVRLRAEGRAEALAGAVGLCRAVASLHASGWVHGDLQPAHGIHTEAGVRLIDFAWAWHSDFEQHLGFKGVSLTWSLLSWRPPSRRASDQ